MIIALVEVPLSGPKRDTEFVIEQSLAATKIFHRVEGLRRKYFLNHERGGGGVYEFETREAADAWFNDDWADWMEGRFGARPVLSIFDCDVVLDNLTDEVRVGGVAVKKPWEEKKDAD